MLETLVLLLPNAVGILLSPLAVVAVVLLLLSPRASGNGLAFLAGWALGLTLVGALTLLVIEEPAGSAGRQPLWALALRLAIAAGLLYLAYRSFAKRPRRGETPRLPGWMSAIDSFSTTRSFSVAAAAAAVKPKNLLLTAAAMIDLALAGLPAGQSALVFAVFVALSSLGIAVPVVYALSGGERAQRSLTAWRAWLQAHNAVIVAVVLALLGVKVLLEALAGL